MKQTEKYDQILDSTVVRPLIFKVAKKKDLVFDIEMTFETGLLVDWIIVTGPAEYSCLPILHGFFNEIL